MVLQFVRGTRSVAQRPSDKAMTLMVFVHLLAQ
jgi:hypothetical protein